LKILLIHTYYTERGGEDTVYEAESALLKSNQIEVENLTFSNADNKMMDLVFAPFNIFSYYRIKRKIAEFKPDVIHMHNWHFAASPSVIWAAGKCNVPIVLTLHNYRLICPSAILFHNGELFFDSLKGGFPWSAVRKKVYRNSFGLTLWLAIVLRWHKSIGTWLKVNRFITLTEFGREVFLKSDLRLKATSIAVKPNFTIPNHLEPSERLERFVFVGRLSEEKGIDLIFEAYKIKKFELVIIGDGPLRPQVEAFVKDNPGVEYMGFQKKETIQEVLQSSSALLFCSKCYESMPMTILESFSLGTPVIAASLGSIPSIVNDNANALLFNNNDANDLALKIQLWLDMPEVKKQEFYCSAKKTFDKKYSASANFNKLHHIYQELIQ
jgi:glycosyltransferase involved in cell wall biosynthesis